MNAQERHKIIERELGLVLGFKYIAFDLRKAVLDYYEKELRAIERMKRYKPNPHISIWWKHD